MKKYMYLMLMLVLMLLVSTNAEAATLVGTFGTGNDSGVHALQVDSDRILTIAADAGFNLPYEKATTNDTITAAESGKTIVVEPTSTTVLITLPDADVGMSYTFVATGGPTYQVDGTGGAHIQLIPQSTDTFRTVPGISPSTHAAGDKLESPGATGDTVTIFCVEDTYWDITNISGTWVNAT